MIPEPSLTGMDTTGSNNDGQEDSILKETASKDDQELIKSHQLFWELLQRGATHGPWN